MCHARLEAEAGRYSFLVLDFHLLPWTVFTSAPNLPRSVLRKRASAPLVFSSRSMAEYTAVTELPKRGLPLIG